jgi:hypothetical protein
MNVLMQDSKNEFFRQSAMFAYECMSEILGIVFEPYLSKVLPMLLKCYGDGSAEVRNAAQVRIVKWAHAFPYVTHPNILCCSTLPRALCRC